MQTIQRDPSTFHPEKPHTFNHALSSHPLFQLEEIRNLAKRSKNIRYHSAMIPRYQAFDEAEKNCHNGFTLEDTIDNIETAGSFVFIMNVETDPLYKPVIEQIAKELKSTFGPLHSNMRKIKAWIFLTSPGGTTPYHRDHEVNHFFHIRGKKNLWLWDPQDPEVITTQENEHFHGVHSLKKTVYRESLLNKAYAYNLVPGEGAYFPYTAPHMVENGDEVAISLSVTFMSDETYAIKRTHKINQLLRKLGLNPGQSLVTQKFKLGLHWMLRNFIFKNSKEWHDA